VSGEWQHQLRLYLPEALADVARADPPALPRSSRWRTSWARTVRPSSAQLDAFEAYVAEAEREGPERYPLYRWTTATLKDPANRLKHMKAFALHVSGQEAYPAETADALEAALQPLLGGGLVERLPRHDTSPANNPAVPAEYRS
jgi:hypothetical protein